MRNRRGKASTIIIIAVAVLVIGITGTFFLTNKASSGHAKPTIEQAKKETIPLDEFVVNLADAKESRYLKAEIVLEIRGSKAKHEVVELKPKIRDKVIQILSSKYYREILAASGKQKLKEELRDSLNSVFEESKVVDVYFTSFAMQ